MVVQVDNHIVPTSSRKLIVRCETNIYSLYRGAAEAELIVIGDDFWLNGGKVSPTIDQRGNRGDPDNSPLTGGACSIQSTLSTSRIRNNLTKFLEVLVMVAFISFPILRL